MERDLDPPPSLHEHAAFLRALARRLTLDPGTADDLVQEAYVRALRQPLPPLRSVRAWLATVVRNVCRDQRAAEHARRQREQEVARLRAGASGCSDPFGIELLSRALAALPVDYRHVIQLRYYAQRSIEQIARELAVPPATVKTRLHRGLAMLRADLAARAGGADAARALLLPLAMAPATAVAAVAPPVLAVAWLPKLAAASLLGAVLFAGLRPDGWWRAVAAPALPADVAAPAAAAARREPSEVVPAGAGQAPRSEREAVVATATRLRGVVTHAASGEPVPFGRVAVRDGAGREDLSADADGRFVTERVFAADAEVATEGVRRPGVAATEARPAGGAVKFAFAVDGIGGVPAQKLLTSPLAANAPARPAQRMVADAWRPAADLRASTGITVPAVVGPTYFLRMALPEGLAVADFEVALAPDEHTNIPWLRDHGSYRAPLEMAPDGSARLWCRLPPVPGNEADRFLFVTSRDGYWAGHAPVTAIAGVAREPVAIELRACGVVQGVLRDASGTPCARVCVDLVHTDATEIRTAYEFTDDRGHFRIAHVWPGPARLEVTGEEVEPCRQPVVVPSGAVLAQDLVVVNRPVGGDLAGTITTASGERFAGCSVILTSRHDTSIWRTSSLQWAAVDGRMQASFVFEAVPLVECEVTLHTFGPCGVPVPSHRVTPPRQGLAFAIDDRPALRPVTFVVTSDGRAAAGDWAIHLTGADGWWSVVGPSGSGPVEVALPSAQRVRWQLVGDRVRARAGEVPAGGSAQVEVATAPGWSQRLHCCDIENYFDAGGVVVFADGVPAGSTDAAGTLWLDLAAAPATLTFDTRVWRVFDDASHHSDVAGRTGTIRPEWQGRSQGAATGLHVYLEHVY